MTTRSGTETSRYPSPPARCAQRAQGPGPRLRASGRMTRPGPGEAPVHCRARASPPRRWPGPSRPRRGRARGSRRRVAALGAHSRLRHSPALRSACVVQDDGALGLGIGAPDDAGLSDTSHAPQPSLSTASGRSGTTATRSVWVRLVDSNRVDGREGSQPCAESVLVERHKARSANPIPTCRTDSRTEAGLRSPRPARVRDVASSPYARPMPTRITPTTTSARTSHPRRRPPSPFPGTSARCVG